MTGCLSCFQARFAARHVQRIATNSAVAANHERSGRADSPKAWGTPWVNWFANEVNTPRKTDCETYARRAVCPKSVKSHSPRRSMRMSVR